VRNSFGTPHQIAPKLSSSSQVGLEGSKKAVLGTTPTRLDLPSTVESEKTEYAAILSTPQLPKGERRNSFGTPHQIAPKLSSSSQVGLEGSKKAVLGTTPTRLDLPSTVESEKTEYAAILSTPQLFKGERRNSLGTPHQIAPKLSSSFQVGLGGSKKVVLGTTPTGLVIGARQRIELH